jgi:hypothetical protein
MKTTLFLLFLIGFLITGRALAQSTITVDNKPSSVAMYSNFEDAYAAAQPGDTILLAGSETDYGTHIIHKRLRIEGPGFLLSENNVPGLATRSAYFYQLTFEKSAQYGDPSNSTIVGISTTNFSVKANISGLSMDKSDSSSVVINSPVAIRRSKSASISCNNGSSGSVITNSIIDNVFNSYNGENNSISVSNCCITKTGGWNAVKSNLSITNSIFTANSLYVSPDAQYRATISHCIGMGNYLPAGSGNLNSQFLTGPGGVFQTFDQSKGVVELRPDSPAKGAGSGGVDMGPSGGPTPYVTGGVPARPRLTFLSAPGAATNFGGLNIQVGAQAFGD